MKKKTTTETNKEVQKTTVNVSDKKIVAQKAVMNGLTEEQVEILKTKILDEKNNLIFKGVYESDEFNLSNEDRSDEVDQANADVNNASRLRFRNREVFYSKKLDEALRRLQAGNMASVKNVTAVFLSKDYMHVQQLNFVLHAKKKLKEMNQITSSTDNQSLLVKRLI